MTIDELKAYLKDALSIRIYEQFDYGGELDEVVVEILLDGEVISTSCYFK